MSEAPEERVFVIDDAPPKWSAGYRLVVRNSLALALSALFAWAGFSCAMSLDKDNLAILGRVLYASAALMWLYHLLKRRHEAGAKSKSVHE